eukprot:scaffold5680_cov86-Cylindrotheca_fusiformis.AAC.2
MDENDAWETAEWEHSISASGAILNGTDIPLNLWDVFVGAATIKHWKVRANGFEFRVSENLSDVEPAMSVEFHH